MPCTPRFLLLLLPWLLPASPASAQTTIYRCTDASGALTVQNKPCPSGSSQSERQMTGVASSPSATAPTPSGAGAGAAAFPTVPGAAAAGEAQDVQRSSDGSFVTTSTGPAPGDIRAPSTQYAADGGVITTSTGPAPRILDSANLPRASEASAAPDPDAPPPPPVFRCVTYDNDSYFSEQAEVPPRCLAMRTVGIDGNPAGGAGRACEVVRDQCSRVADGGACEAWRRLSREAESRWRFAHPDNVDDRRAEYDRLAKIVGTSCGAP